MRQLLLLMAITCIVLDQSKTKAGWLTSCKGIEVDGEVVFDKKILAGQAVHYKPFIIPKDEFIHGEILSIGDAPSCDTGACGEKMTGSEKSNQ